MKVQATCRSGFGVVHLITRSARMLLLSVVTSSLLAACSSTTVSEGAGSGSPAASPVSALLPDPAALTDCADAFEVWAVDGSAALNSGGDMIETIAAMEGLQRRVFELCSLADAEQLNRDVLVDGRSMIEPDFRTFAEVECADEAPLLDGTSLCVEVGQ